jgi:cysteine desulfurase
MKIKRVYLDHAAGTPLVPEAKRAMRRAERLYANPSSIHSPGVDAMRLLADARASVAFALNCSANDVIFVSGGSEANTLAIVGSVTARHRSGVPYSSMHIITTAIEHPSVLRSCEELALRGVAVSYIAPRADGTVTPEDFMHAVRPETVLISVGYVNSEIGVIQKVADIARAVRRAHVACGGKGILVHTDASQAIPWMPVHRETLQADLLSIDSGKCGGPKGVGALSVSPTVAICPLIPGGGQERGIRAGTENISGCVGFATALSQRISVREKAVVRIARYRDELYAEIMKSFPDAVVNGSMRRRLPNNLNISIPGLTSELTVIALDRRGVFASAGTACASVDGPSKVVSAIAPHAPWRAECALRFTLGLETTRSDIKRVVKALSETAHYMSKK